VSPKVPRADVDKTLAVAKQIAQGRITINPIIKF